MCNSNELSVLIPMCALKNSQIDWRQLTMGNACPGRLFDTLGSETNSEIIAEKVGFKFGVGECGIERDGFTYKTMIRGEFGFENRY